MGEFVMPNSLSYFVCLRSLLRSLVDDELVAWRGGYIQLGLFQDEVRASLCWTVLRISGIRFEYRYMDWKVKLEAFPRPSHHQDVDSYSFENGHYVTESSSIHIHQINIRLLLLSAALYGLP